MARYIDADIILARLQARTKFFPYDSATEDTVNTVTYWINGELEKQKDVAPVVHAYNKSKDGFLCSACTFGDFGLFNHGGKYTPKYCPNCGARMDEKEGE